MQAFQIHKSIVEDYKSYLQSFTFIRDSRIKVKVDEAFEKGTFLPEALIQFNPSFKTEETLIDLEKEGIHPDLKKIFGNYNLYKHQIEAIRKGVKGESFIVTSGTGSGKSLTFLASIFNRIISNGEGPGVKAILVYPMNALINSQEEEIKKYEINYLKSFLFGQTIDEEGKSLDEILVSLRQKVTQRFPITYSKFTGQESSEQREKAKEAQSNIILTNYMMLELIMTRNDTRWLRDSMEDNLVFLVFDELHTYRGRQGSDVSILIRRIKGNAKKQVTCIGTSATMVSSGTISDRKLAVAKVANQIFSSDFTEDQIIGETLATSTRFSGSLPSREELEKEITNRDGWKRTAEAFNNNPLAIWLENAIALKREDGSDFLERGSPKTLNQITSSLAEYTGAAFVEAESAILKLLQWVEELNIDGSKQTPRKSFLPFKIHQFVSQTGNVHVTLEGRDDREITMETGLYVNRGGKDIPIFPVLFSRYSGYDFICVSKENGKLKPRNPDEIAERILKSDLKGNKDEGVPKRILKEDDFPDGYIILDDGNEPVWSDEKEELLPENWFNKSKKKAGTIENFFEFRLPKKIYFNEEGEFSEIAKYPNQGWFIAARLLIDPTAGIVFDQKTNENTKLMRLGNEGRSTATTITAFSVIKSLNEQGVKPKNQKLLSFTDNRQDASLQAGHFNDFLMLGRLRSAIYHALKEEDSKTLDIDTIGEKVFKKLNLKEKEYARYPSDDEGWADIENEKALKDYLIVRILYDLKRGWRYNTPNLEQCDLVQIEYARLMEFCERDEFFEGLLLFKGLKFEERYFYFVQILTFFRTSYALEYYKIGEKREETEERLKNKLDESKIWSLDLDERIETPFFLLPESVGDTNYRVYTASIGPMSYLGKYLKRLLRKHGQPVMKNEELTNFIKEICKRLDKKFLFSVEVKGKSGTTTGYRLKVDVIRWKLGKGEKTQPDEVRIARIDQDSQIELLPNSFFKNFYTQDFKSFKGSLLAREHTGQLSSQDRIDREDDFRKGLISSLFCSPTMELGIDIAELNVVHMRNVPPSPANYAQRSGRAGRSGQAALVFTYCSNGSPHDRNYFKESHKMVAGAVVPPKIDLSNEELIETHFNAYILMELGISQLQTSANDVLEVGLYPEIPLKADLIIHIKEQLIRFGNSWAQNFYKIVEQIPEAKNSNWFSPEWFSTRANNFYEQFNLAFLRWRNLYISATELVERARRDIDDPTIKSDNPRKGEAKREERVGLRQRDLLLNNARKSYGNESEFYVFRYLAAEGFLPGYNFTRLPIRAFLGNKHQDRGEYVSRPRFIALKEFGPNNLIYHNGGKYKISKMQLSHSETIAQKLMVSKITGYAFLNDDAIGVNNDPITNQELKGQDLVDNWGNLLELGESEAKPQERISCEEEERMSTGYEVDQYFSFSNGIANTRQATLKIGDQPLLQVIYDKSARLIQVNQRWRKAKDQGFNIGKASGRWKQAKELETPSLEDPSINVRLFTTDTADILYLQPIKDLGLNDDGVTTLSYALKRAIERQFQAEEGEIGVWIMGKGEQKNILMYEASEGSLGILSELVVSSLKLKSVFEEAYKALHFDPNTRTDLRPNGTKASYDDLLSYFNQRDHDKMDRYLVKVALEKLMDCQIDNQAGGRSLEDQYEYLTSNYDLNSSTEKPLIDFLLKNGIALPDKAQFNVPGCYVNADFIFKNPVGYTLVFCDGSVHDSEEQKKLDRQKRQCCRDAGFDVVEWHYMEPIEKLVERRKDIFRKVR